MKKKLWWILVIVIAGGMLWREYGQKENNPGRETAPDYVKYVNNQGRYSMMVPADWEVNESTDEARFVSRTVFTPGKSTVRLGNIGELSITVVASPSATQSLSTQKEFDYWLAQPIKEASDGADVKIANEKISGQQAVRLVYTESIPEKTGTRFWSVTSWVRKEGVNYYINMMGNGKDFKSETGPFSWMLSKFSFLP